MSVCMFVWNSDFFYIIMYYYDYYYSQHEVVLTPKACRKRHISPRSLAGDKKAHVDIFSFFLFLVRFLKGEQ